MRSFSDPALTRSSAARSQTVGWRVQANETSVHCPLAASNWSRSGGVMFTTDPGVELLKSVDGGSVGGCVAGSADVGTCVALVASVVGDVEVTAAVAVGGSVMSGGSVDTDEEPSSLHAATAKT